jgi:hypothetical protein
MHGYSSRGGQRHRGIGIRAARGDGCAHRLDLRPRDEPLAEPGASLGAGRDRLWRHRVLRHELRGGALVGFALPPALQGDELRGKHGSHVGVWTHRQFLRETASRIALTVQNGSGARSGATQCRRAATEYARRAILKKRGGPDKPRKQSSFAKVPDTRQNALIRQI